LIRVFCVFVVGEPIILGDDTQQLGFYRNEYVATFSKERAIAVAKANTLKRLERKGAKFIDGMPFVLKVEQVKSGMPMWRLFRREAFLFFPVDS